MMLDILRDSVGFAGCSIARRTVGIAGNADIREIEPIRVRSQLEIANLQLSKLLISKYKIINGVDDFENIVRDFFADIQVNT
jgi:5-methylthioribose kinase